MTKTSNHRFHPRSSGIIVWVLLFFHTVTGQLLERDLHQMIGVPAWSHDELRALEKGEIVVRPLETNEKQELASIGIVRIRNLPAISMDKFRESLGHKGSHERKAGGRFGEPPTLEDMSTLELDAAAVDQLRKCTVGRCNLNLSAEMITRFQREIDWTSPNAEAEAKRLIAEMIVGYVRDYLATGNDSLGTYDNRRKTVDLVASHRSFLSSSTLVSGLAPELVEYLRTFPGGKLENVRSNLHWSVVDFGLKPSITVSHTVAYTQIRDGHEQLFVASKQIYSSRYLDSSLTFTLLLRTVTESGVDSYLILVDRSRSDALEGAVGRFARKLVQKESSERIRTWLNKTHLRLLGSREGDTNMDPSSNEESSAPWIGLIRPRSTAIAIGGIIVVAALFLLWRRRKARETSSGQLQSDL